MVVATVSLVLGLVVANLLVASTFGRLECEDLRVEECAFSVASSGTRCVLEKYKSRDDSIQYACQSSIILAEKQEEWIESDECVKACGLERMSVGLSTDLLLDAHFTEMLCSSECVNNCPNLIDLYISLAAGEGMYLPQLCKTHRMFFRRSIADPVKKVLDEGYGRRFFASEIAPEGSETPETGGAGIQKSGPAYDYRGEIAPTSLPQAPAAGGPSTTKRPFFTASSPPTPILPTPTPSPEYTGAPETTPYIYASSPEMAPAPSTPQLSPEELYWHRRVEAEKAMLERTSQLDVGEEYLYEAFFY